MGIPSPLKDSVVFIYTEMNGTGYPQGTAFLIYLDEGDLVHSYLVTCKHVVKPLLDDGIPVDIRVNRSDTKGVAYERQTGQWHYHDDPAVDLAVLIWEPKQSLPRDLVAIDFESAELTEKKLTARRHSLGEGDDVMFIGLFAEYTGYERNLPVVRFGRLAMVTNELLEGEYGSTQQHLIECQAYPGNSGAPLFIELPPLGLATKPLGDVFMPPSLQLLGVVASFYPHKQVLHQVSKSGGQTEIQVYTHFGISAAVPVNRIRDILYSEVLMKKRAERIKQERAKKKPEPASLKVPEAETTTVNSFEDALKRASRKTSEL